MVRVEAGTGVGPAGMLGWSAHPLGGALHRDCVRDPAFAPDTSEAAAGFWPFCILFIFAPTLQACSYF